MIEGDNGAFLIKMNLILVAITAFCFIYFVGRAKRKENPAAAAKARQKAIRRHEFYLKFIPTRRLYGTALKNFAVYGISSKDDLAVQAATTMDKFILYYALALGFGLVFLRNPLYTAFFLLLVHVVCSQTIIVKTNNICKDIYKEFSGYLSLYRQSMISTKSVIKSFQVVPIPPVFEKVIHDIIHIIERDDEIMLEEMTESYPLPLMSTFANCVHAASKSIDDIDGTLLIIQQECDLAYREIERTRIKNKGYSVISLVGLVIWPVAEMFNKGQIPGTAVLLDGMYGNILHMAILVLTIGTYRRCTNAKLVNPYISTDVSETMANIMANPIVHKVVSNVMPKKTSKIKKLRSKLNDAASNKNIQYLYTERVLYFVIGFVATLLALLFIVFSTRSLFKNNYDSLSIFPMDLSVTQKQQLHSLDDEFLNISESEYKNYSEGKDADEVMSHLVKSRVTGLGDMEIGQQVERLRTKYETYHGSVPRWWFPIVALLVAIVLSRIPINKLRSRSKMLKSCLEDEVSQLQTLMVVCSQTPISCEKTLILLERHARVLKVPLCYALTIYKKEPKKALDYLLGVTDSIEFKQIVNKLYDCIYDISVTEAFADMTLQKQQSLSVTEMKHQEKLESKTSTLRLISVLPALIAVIGCFVAPILILGISQFSEISAGLLSS